MTLPLAGVDGTSLLWFCLLIILAGVAVNFWLSLKQARLLRELMMVAEKISYHDLLALSQQRETLERLRFELDLPDGPPPTRGWAASPDFLLEITRHIRAARPQIVVECGSGSSTIALARAIELNGAGHLYSLDHDPVFAEATRRNLARYGLSAVATVIDGPLIDHPVRDSQVRWYDFPMFPGPIDLLVVDGPPRKVTRWARYPAGPLLFPKLAPAAAVFLDDADRPDEQEAVSRWRREFPFLDYRYLPFEKGCVLLQNGGNGGKRLALD